MKILFTDLDGTLLNDKSVVSKHTADILKKYTEAGNKLVLSSGRSLESVIKVKNDNHLDFPGMYICAANGTIVYECDTDTILFTELMNMEDVESIWQYNVTYPVHIQTYSEKELIVYRNDRESDYYRIRCPLDTIESKTPWEILKNPPCKMLAIDLDNHHKLEEFATIIKENYPNLTTLFSNDRYLEIFSSKAGKGNSLIRLCDHLSIPVSDSFAFGDEENDLSMITAAGTGVLMKNGNPAISSYADIITEKTNDNDGLADFIEQKIL